MVPRSRYYELSILASILLLAWLLGQNVTARSFQILHHARLKNFGFLSLHVKYCMTNVAKVEDRIQSCYA